MIILHGFIKDAHLYLELTIVDTDLASGSYCCTSNTSYSVRSYFSFVVCFVYVMYCVMCSACCPEGGCCSHASEISFPLSSMSSNFVEWRVACSSRDLETTSFLSSEHIFNNTWLLSMALGSPIFFKVLQKVKTSSCT